MVCLAVILGGGGGLALAQGQSGGQAGRGNDAVASAAAERIRLAQRLVIDAGVLTQYRIDSVDYGVRADTALGRSISDDPRLRAAVAQLVVRAYARIYSNAELQAALDFYTSPAGRSFILKARAIDARVGEEIDRVVNRFIDIRLSQGVMDEQ